MVKYTVMKFLIIALAFLTSSAYAAKVDLPRPTEVDCCDGEASTNEVFAAGSMSGNWFCVMLENAALTNNTVAVEFGKDADGDGALSCDEVGVSLGWMCGKMFLKDCASNLAVARDLGSGQHKLEWRFRLIPGRLGSRALMTDGQLVVLDQVFPAPLIDEAWDLVRVVRRGVSSGSERVSYSRFDLPFRIIVR